MLRYLLLLAGTLAAEPEVTMQIGDPSRGDGGPGTHAILDGPWGLATDREGVIYVAESNAARIRRILPTGEIETFAGTGAKADGRDGVPARETPLVKPTVLLVDAEGALIFADAGPCRIRRILLTGEVHTLAGTGRCAAGGFPRDRRALETDLGPVGGMTFDPAGRLVFTDEQTHTVRRLDPDGLLRTIAGSGSSGFFGDTGPATSAQLNTPAGVAYDTSGNLYIADGRNCRVRRVNPEGIINTVAGRATCATRSSGFVNGSATATALGRLQGLAYHPETNTLLIASTGQARIVQYGIDTLRLTNYAGNGSLGPIDSTVLNRVNEPRAIAFHPTLGALATASSAFQILQVTDGQVRVIAGRWPQIASPTPVPEAVLLQPNGLCAAPDGALLIVDSGSEQVLRLSAGELSPVAGALHPTGFTAGDDADALLANLASPRRIACAPNGDVYVSAGSQVRLITAADGLIRNVTRSYLEPTGLAIDADGRLLIADAASHQLIRYDPSARTFTKIAGTGTAGFSGDGGPASDAQLNWPGDLALDPMGNIYLADRGNRRVRRISPDGQIRTIAGSLREFSYGDISGQPPTDVGLGFIAGLAVDTESKLYILESERLSSLTPDGEVNVLFGYLTENDDGVVTYRGEPLDGASGLLAADGRLYLALQPAPRILELIHPAASAQYAPTHRQSEGARTATHPSRSVQFRDPATPASPDRQ
jgi:sugar lactone lactonase YvrE